MKLAGDNRAGVRSDDWEIADPSQEQITEAVDRLDGSQYTETSLEEANPFRYLSVAGGPDLYLVTGETPDDEIIQLLSTGTGDEPVSLVCGGQRADYQRSELVTRDEALGAIAEFVKGFPAGLGDRWHVQ